MRNYGYKTIGSWNALCDAISRVHIQNPILPLPQTICLTPEKIAILSVTVAIANITHTWCLTISQAKDSL